MLDYHTQQTSEDQLAVLLGELLEGERARHADAAAEETVPAEIGEMRDLARLLRAASQSAPLPEGRFVVRRALLATLPPSGLEWMPARAAWRRTGRWLSTAAMVGMLVVAFGLGAGALDSIGSSSNPLYGFRRAVDGVRQAFAPGRTPTTPSALGSAQARAVEIGEFPGSGYARPAGLTGYPLINRFSGVRIPSTPGQEVTAQGTVGGLPTTLALTATSGCPANAACGVFEAWITPLRGTRASPEFGQMRGTFVCAAGKCTLTPVSKTGVFNTVSAFVTHSNTSGELVGFVETGLASLGDWVSTVEQAAATLKSEDLLPVGVTVTDLVRDAATNQSAPPRRPPQGTTRPSTTGSGSSVGVSVGVPASGSGSSVTVGTGTGASPGTSGEIGAGGLGASFGAGVSNGTSGASASGGASSGGTGVGVNVGGVSTGGGTTVGGGVGGGKGGGGLGGGLL